jgi:prophage regulatory protein
MKPIVVRKPQLQDVAGVSCATAGRLEREGRFPKRRQLADGSVGWLVTEIEAWAAALPPATGELRGERTRLARQRDSEAA